MTLARAALCAALLLSASACARPRADEDKAFGDKVHAYLLAHPEVLLEMQDAYVRKQTSAEATQVQSHIAALRKQIFDDPRDPSVGPKDAKVTVVEFFDYRCPHCKDAAPDVLNLIRTHPDVRFVFKEFPIFGAQSQMAAATALAANREGKYLPVYAGLMTDRVVDLESVGKVLKQSGLDPARVQAAAGDPQIAAQLGDIQRLAQSLGVTGTPGFLVNDTYVAGADIPALTKAIDEAKKKG
jgi:protein-disulfide isomerase